MNDELTDNEKMTILCAKQAMNTLPNVDSETQKSLQEEMNWRLQLDIHQYESLLMLSAKQTPEEFFAKSRYFKDTSMSESEKAEAVKKRVDDFYAFEEECKEKWRLQDMREAKERANSTDTWYHMITRALEKNGETWEDVVSQNITEEQKKVDPFRDKDVDYVEFRLWTNNYVYYSYREDDGDNWAWVYSCQSVPRNP